MDYYSHLKNIFASGEKNSISSPRITSVKPAVYIGGEKEYKRKEKMIGMIWNIRGIGPNIKKFSIRTNIYDKKVDFIGLQETIKSDFTKNELHNLYA